MDKKTESRNEHDVFSGREQLEPCDRLCLDTFLRSNDYCLEDQELISHLDSCENCRRFLESQAAEQAIWNLASQLLRPQEFDKSNNRLFSAGQTTGLEFNTTQNATREVLASLAPTDNPNHLGKIGPYEVTGIVGFGGMGVVLKAIDPSLDRVVAVKVMAPRLANIESARRRFAREAKAAAAVMHPNVIPIHSVSSESPLPYLVMAFNRGGSLQKRLQHGKPLPLVEILRIGSQIAAGLAAAHDQGLIHRDIKPENILLEEGVERVAITDFGLARAVDDNTITHNGAIAGTPMYMSPEQARGESLDQLSDLFSFGSLLYALCTGRPPFQSDTSYSVMRQIIDDSPPPIQATNPEIPDWLVVIVEKLMSKEKSSRFSSAKEVQRLLEICLSHTQQPHLIPLPTELSPALATPNRTLIFSKKGVLFVTTLTLVFFATLAFILQIGGPRLTISNPSSSKTLTNSPIANSQQAPAALTIIKHKEEGSDEKGKTLTHRWNLEGKAISNMTIRIHHVVGGETQVVSESLYEDDLPGDLTMEVELQLKNTGEVLASPGKAVIPTLAVTVNGLQVKSSRSEKLILLGEHEKKGFSSEGSLTSKHVLFHAGICKQETDKQPTMESLQKASRDGSSFIALEVAWNEHGTSVATFDNRSELANPQELLGEWRLIYFEVGGKALPQKAFRSISLFKVFRAISLTIDESTMTSSEDGKVMNYSIVANSTPIAIDLKHSPEKLLKGILDLQGDTLRICFGESERPVRFESINDSRDVSYLVLKRIQEHDAYDFADEMEIEFFFRNETSSPNFPDGELTVEQAQELIEDLDLNLMSVKRMSPEVATVLATTRRDLWLPDANELPPLVLRELAKKQKGRLYLDKMERLFDGAAVELGKTNCPLSLSGIDWISVDDATELAKLQHPLKIGLKQIEADAAKKLAEHKDWLILHKLTKLNIEAAEALAGHKGRLSLNGLISITPEIGEALGKYDGEGLELRNLAALDLATAKELSQVKCRSVLSLNGLQSLTPEVILELAKGDYSLELQGLIVRDIETRRSLDSAHLKLRSRGKTLVWGEIPEPEPISLGE